ncbi:MAG TPA: aspartate-alanine antiporter [Gemmataceae bacterium]|nr:aspartate-alanine antiporter [Gemmataceae bacterium]
MSAVTELLRGHPEVALFAALSLGFFLGTRKIGTFSLGTAAGVLLAGVVIGQLRIPIPAALKAVSFALFIFVVGYRVGPQFFRGLKGEGLRLAALALILAVTGLLTAYAVAVLLGYDKGTAAGLLGGSLTQSAILGSASDAIARLDRDPEAKLLLSNNMSVAFAVSYLFGTAGVAWFLSRVGPRLLGIDLAAACAALGRDGGESDEGKLNETPASGPFLIRVFRVQGPPWVWATVGEVETAHSGRLLIERVRHQGELHEAELDTVIHPGDTLAVAGYHDELFPLLNAIGEEVDDPELLAFPLETLPVVVTSKAADGRTLEELLRAHGRGVSITRLTRSGREMPLVPGRHAHRGDTLHLVGPRRHVEQAALALGYADRPAVNVDVVYVALGIALGALVGIPTLTVGGVSVGLGAAGGILLAGLAFGWLRARSPTFGRFPVPAMWVFEVLGLHLFLAAVGISSGPAFVTGLAERGLGLLLAGVVVALVPHAVTLLAGRRLFPSLHPGVLLGACAGAGVSSAALTALEEAAGSKVPALGYNVPYAVGNTLLTLAGPLLVALVQ